MQIIIQLAVVVAALAGMWKTFEKMGLPGWKGIVPIYNLFVLLELFQKPTWWLIMFFIPFVNLYFGYLVFLEVAKGFGKGGGYAVGLLLLGFVFWPMLGFGSDRWLGAPGGPQGFAPIMPPPPPGV